jgi:hypothetical protein
MSGLNFMSRLCVLAIGLLIAVNAKAETPSVEILDLKVRLRDLDMRVVQSPQFQDLRNFCLNSPINIRFEDLSKDFLSDLLEISGRPIEFWVGQISGLKEVIDHTEAYASLRTDVEKLSSQLNKSACYNQIREAQVTLNQRFQAAEMARIIGILNNRNDRKIPLPSVASEKLVSFYGKKIEGFDEVKKSTIYFYRFDFLMRRYAVLQIFNKPSMINVVMPNDLNRTHVYAEKYPVSFYPQQMYDAGGAVFNERMLNMLTELQDLR